jgi:hypothetical protein
LLKLSINAFFAWAFLTTATFAQSVGIDFAKMPVGTKIFFQSWNGDTWISTFKGKKGKNYIVSVDVSKKGRSYRGTQRYTLDGHMQRWNNGGGYTERWRPYSCARIVGSCTHKWTDTNGRGASWFFENTLNGNTLTQKSRSKRDVEMRIGKAKLGKYNLTTRLDWTTSNGSKRWQRISKIVEPN